MNFGKESETVEFKETTHEIKEGVRSIASMLNKNGHAILYFGVKNSGEAKGQQCSDGTLRDVSQAITTNIEPAVIPAIKEIDLPGTNLKVIKVEVSGKDIPYSAYGQYLIRSADEDRKVPRGALKSMFQGSGADLISEMESTRQDLTFEQLVSLFASKGYHITSLESFSRSKGLLNSEGRYNLMALLLSDQSNVSIKVVRFSGTDKTAMSQRKDFGNQCLIIALQQAMDYVETLNETNVVLGRGARRDTPLFDVASFEEAWKNACVHNSWSELVPPAIYIYSDRIEVVSCGGLPFGLSEDDFFHGYSRPINKALWAIFNSADYAEQTGHGVPTIVGRYGMSAFRITDNFITVTFRFPFKPTWAKADEANAAPLSLSENQETLIKAIKANPYATNQELAESTGLGLSLVKKNVSSLKKAGLLERKGTNRKGYWEVRK